MWTKKGNAFNINRNPLLCLSWNAIALINTLFHCNCNFIPVSPFIVIQMLSTWDATKFEISEEDPHNAPYSLIEILNNDTTVRAVLQKFIEKSTQKKGTTCDNTDSHRINRMSALRTFDNTPYRRKGKKMRLFNLLIQLSYALFYSFSKHLFRTYIVNGKETMVCWWNEQEKPLCTVNGSAKHSAHAVYCSKN